MRVLYDLSRLAVYISANQWAACPIVWLDGPAVAQRKEKRGETATGFNTQSLWMAGYRVSVHLFNQNLERPLSLSLTLSDVSDWSPNVWHVLCMHQFNRIVSRSDGMASMFWPRSMNNTEPFYSFFFFVCQIDSLNHSKRINRDLWW